MKKLTFLFAVILMFSAISFAQKESPKFEGNWTLDVEKSELGERSRIKSMKMTVTQSAEELSYERKAERETGSGGGGRRGMRRGGGGNALGTFDLSGKETTAPSPGGRGGPSKLKAEMAGDYLKLTRTREFESQMGAVTITTVEKWTLSEDGKTLTVTSETETPRGSRNSKMVFTRDTQ